MDCFGMRCITRWEPIIDLDTCSITHQGEDPLEKKLLARGEASSVTPDNQA